MAGAQGGAVVFGIGMPELLVVLVIGLLVLGPKRLPEIARSLGRGMSEFRRASTELRESLTSTFEPADKPADKPAGKPAGKAEGDAGQAAAREDASAEKPPEDHDTDDSKSDG